MRRACCCPCWVARGTSHMVRTTCQAIKNAFVELGVRLALVFSVTVLYPINELVSEARARYART